MDLSLCGQHFSDFNKKHSLLAERKRVKEIQATSHLSHHKKPSSQGYAPTFRGESERVKDESLSGSNNKEVLPYTSSSTCPLQWQ